MGGAGDWGRRAPLLLFTHRSAQALAAANRLIEANERAEGGSARGAPWEVCESVYRLVAAHGLQAAR